MKTRTKQPKEPEFNYQFQKDAILAQVKGSDKPALFKVLEDMKTNDGRSRLRVVELQEKDQKNGKVIYQEGEEKSILVKEPTKVVDQVEVKTQKPNARSKSLVTFFTFQEGTLKDLAQAAKKPSKQPPQKKAKETSSSDEDQDDEEEQEDSPPPQKRNLGKKGSKKETKQQEEPKRRESARRAPVAQKQVEDEPARPKRGRTATQAKKQKESESEASPQKSESEDDDEAEIEESETPKKKGRKKADSQSQGRKKKAPTPTKFVKGKFNPNYKELATLCEQLETRSDKFIDRGSIKMNNKEVIRAAKLGSIKLFNDIMEHSIKISDLFERWAPETDFNAVELIFERQDKVMLQNLLQVLQKLPNKYKLAHTPRCSLKEIQTGYNDKFAYGTRTRKVALSRGGREGNNAFVYDLNKEQPWGHFMIQRLMQIESNPEFFDLISATLGANFSNQFYEQIAFAVRCGNYRTAGHLIKEAFQKGSFYGFNQVHVDVLTQSNASKLGAIKKPSATKKTTGAYLITPIHCAAINPNSGMLAKLIEVSQEFNILDEIHRKPVHYAAVSQTPACLEYLLKNGIDAREGDRNKNTPLMLAAQYGRTHNVELLVANNVNGKNREGNAAIHLAAQGGHIETIKCLLKNGANINLPGQSRMTPLIIASAWGHYDLVKFLLDEGAKVLQKDKFGRSSLVMAARNGNLKILSLLLKHGADYNLGDSSKNTPLHYAAAYGFPECISHLIQAGADQNLVNSWKLTPLSVAMQKNHFGIVKQLLNYPTTDVNCKDDEGRTLVSSSLGKFTSDSFEYIKYLIQEKNADIGITDLKGKSPLHYAVQLVGSSVSALHQNWSEMTKKERKQAKHEYEALIDEVITLLIEHGANVNQPDNDGQTPFILALASHNFKTVKQLMRMAKPQYDLIDKSDKNILHRLLTSQIFFKKEGTAILQEILSQVPQDAVNAVEENGFTPLLLFVYQYSHGAPNAYQDLVNKKIVQLQQAKFEVEMQKIDENQIDEEKNAGHNADDNRFNQDDDGEQDEEDGGEDDDEENEGMEEEDDEEEQSMSQSYPKIRRPPVKVLKARTQQTARRVGGGLFGSAFPVQSTLAQPATSNQFHQRTFYYKSKTVIVHLTNDEVMKIKEECKQALQKLEKQALQFYASLVKRGAKVDEVVAKRKKFRNVETKECPYTEQGLKGCAHFLFGSYHSVSFLSEILKVKPLDFNIPNYKQEYPIHLFAQTCNQLPICGREDENSLGFLKFVINKIQVGIKDDDNNTATSILGTRYVSDIEPFILFLQEHGGEIDNLNKKNVVPLQHWVKNGNLQVVEVFLTKFRANPNFLDRDRRNTLHHAINRSNSQADASFEMEQLLISHGARTDQQDRFLRTPIFYAFTKIGKPDEKFEIDPFETVSSIMADKNCSVNILDRFKRSPLHYASLRGSVISGRYMIKYGAKVDEPDGFENTPLGLAFIAGHSNFATMLVDNKADVNREAHIIDFQKIKLEEKKEREERRAKGEEVESEEEDKDQNVPATSSQVHTGGLFGMGKQPAFSGGLFGGRAVATVSAPQPTTFAPGVYSYFKLAIKHGWQGVAYLLISDGYDLQRAIEDAMMEGQFKLVRTLLQKVKDDEIIRKSNKNNQNLFHIFAIKGAKCPQEFDLQIAKELLKRGVNSRQQDHEKKTPLHYTAEHDFHNLTIFFFEQGCDANLYDSTRNTPFTVRLQHWSNKILQLDEFNEWIRAKTNLNAKFKVNKKDYELTPFLFLIQELHLEEEIALQKFIDSGADINESNQLGETAVVIAIKNNSLKLLNFVLSNTKFEKEKHARDHAGKSPIHHVVQPLEFGSYENVEILERLIPLFDYNAADSSGKTPLDYANDQDSGIMAKFLQKYNAKQSSSRQRRLPTSIVSQAEWVEEEIDVEADAKKFLDAQVEVIDETKEDPRTQVDKYAHQQGGKLEVYIDQETGPYTLLMTKVDVQNGRYSENVFYKMQVLHEINRNVFILFTRWGRIGTEGQYQMTPFESAEVACKEFCKIFSSKAGNDWKKVSSEEEPFEKKQGKYQLMMTTTMKNYKHFLKPFDFSKTSPYPPCKLDNHIRRVLLQFTQVKLYQRDLQQFHVDMDFLPLERLDRKLIEKAKAILSELSDLVEDLQTLRSKSEIDIKAIGNIQSEICEKSSRFYELIPQVEMRTDPLPPLENREAINQKLLLVETLLNFEITSKILLGAHLMKTSLHPLNYCFNALNIRMLSLPKEHPEFKLIQTYIFQSGGGYKISNIFAIERRNEAERFEPHKQFGNRQLLWHGSKISNFMGILAQGLKVAPPWAFNTGAMFGKGIYFADMFQKSYAYTEDWSLHYNNYNGMFTSQHRYHSDSEQDEQAQIQRYRYMLLCEVALGKCKDLYQSEYVTELKGHQSVKGCGQRGPDYKQSITLANGCKVPVGNIVTYEQPDKKDKDGNKVVFCLQHNEYIVYDESKVKIRYMVQIDQKETKDEY